MPKPQSVTNPFYVLLLLAGVLFVITACAYFTMAVREADGAASAGHGLMKFLSQYGLQLLIGELLLLAIGTFGAISTDEYWSRRAASRARQAADSDSSSQIPPQ